MATVAPLMHHVEGRNNLYKVFNEYCDLVRSNHLPSGQQSNFQTKGMFTKEYFRLCSFNLDKEDIASFSASQLALDGFYKTGVTGLIQCFSCGYKHNVRDSTRDPFRSHRQYGSNCLHLKGQDPSNVPLSPGAPSPREREYAQTLNREVTGDIRPQARWSSEAIVQSEGNARRDRSRVEEQHRDNGGGRNSGDTESGTSDNNRKRRNLHRQVAVVDFRYELCRFQSYTNWPSNASISPEELSNAGFYYMGMDDRVQCIFCRGILRCWEPEDKALAEHLRHFPQCPFLLDPVAVGNVALGDEDERLFSAVQTRTGNQFQIGGASIEGVITSTPIHTDKVHISARLATFRDFPTNTWHKADQLAEAGFFYTGEIDTVCCYFCNLHVSHWQHGEDPWVVHARKSDKCGFLLMSKDKRFLEEAKKPKSHKTRSSRAKAKRLKVSQGDIDKFMQSAMVAAIKDGYDETLLQKVVKRRFQELGEGFPNAEALLDAVMEYQEDSFEESDTDDEGDAGSEDATKHCTATPKVTPRLVPDMEELEDLDEDTLIRQNAELVEERRCKVCLEEPACIVFLRCGHLVCCSSCAPALTRCPICRDKILGTICVDM